MAYNKNYRNTTYSATQDTVDMDIVDDLSSEYNEQVGEMKRLHERWLAADRAAIRGDFQVWRWNLDVIWRMLVARACQIHPTEYVEENNRLDREISKNLRYGSKRDIYEALNNKDVFLRLLESKTGVGGKMRDNTFSMRE